VTGRCQTFNPFAGLGVQPGENYTRELQENTERRITLVSHPFGCERIPNGFVAPGLAQHSRDFWCAHTVTSGRRLYTSLPIQNDLPLPE